MAGRDTAGRRGRQLNDHVIVQGHTPVLTPVNNRVSSSLTLDGGENSAFWRLLQRHGADAYLAGEVHDITVTQDRADPALLQIAHGGILGFEQADTISYLVGTVDGPTVTYDLYLCEDLVTYDGRTMSIDGNSTTRFNLDLSALDLDPAGAFAFRFQFADTDGHPRTIRLDEVGLAADLVAVPEPGGLITTGIGALILLRRRRDRLVGGPYCR